MRYAVICPVCRNVIWIRGEFEPDTNATVLDDHDPNWNASCEHVGKTGEYDIGESEAIDDGDE